MGSILESRMGVFFITQRKRARELNHSEEMNSQEAKGKTLTFTVPLAFYQSHHELFLESVSSNDQIKAQLASLRLNSCSDFGHPKNPSDCKHWHRRRTSKESTELWVEVNQRKYIGQSIFYKFI